MKTFQQLTAILMEKLKTDPRAAFCDVAPLASDEELDRLAQLFLTAIHSDTKRERDRLLREYRAELAKYQPCQTSTFRGNTSKGDLRNDTDKRTSDPRRTGRV